MADQEWTRTPGSGEVWDEQARRIVKSAEFDGERARVYIFAEGEKVSDYVCVTIEHASGTRTNAVADTILREHNTHAPLMAVVQDYLMEFLHVTSTRERIKALLARANGETP